MKRISKCVLFGRRTGIKTIAAACIVLACSRVALGAPERGGKYTGDSSEKLDSLPYISFIVDFDYVYRSIEDEKLRDANIPSLLENTDSAGIMERGFNINYAEAVFDADMGSGTRLFGNLLFTPEESKIQEAYAHRKDLPGGFAVKAGRFLSGMGLLNRKHAHEQDFSDVPLIYLVFFGREQLLENGLQFIWEVPGDLGINLGLEVLEGDNKMSFGTEQIGNNSIEIDPSGKPNLFTGYIDGLITADNFEVGFCFSGAFGWTRKDNGLESARGSAIEGTTMLLGGGLMVKYLYSSFQYLSLEGEFLARITNGDLFEGTSSGTSRTKISNTHYGFYSQLTVQPLARVRAGLRGSMVMGQITSEAEDGAATTKTWANHIAPNMIVGSAMIAYTTSANSRIRLQYNYDMSKQDDEFTVYNMHEGILDCTFVFGSHERFL